MARLHPFHGSDAVMTPLLHEHDMMHDATAYRRLASRLGYALREARTSLAVGDPRVLEIKGVLETIGRDLRPRAGVPPATSLQDGPPRCLQMADFLARLASRGGPADDLDLPSKLAQWRRAREDADQTDLPDVFPLKFAGQHDLPGARSRSSSASSVRPN